MTREDYKKILKQYKEKPTLTNDISSVEEATQLDEALDMAIKALEQTSKYRKEAKRWKNKALKQKQVLEEIRAEIENHCGLAKENHCKYCSYCNCVMGVREILEIIDKYKSESEGEYEDN